MIKKDSKSSGSADTNGPLRYKKVLSPTESKRSELNFKSQKLSEARSIERQKNLKGTDPQQNQKGQQQQSSRSSRQEQGRQQRGVHLSRSRSKEQKDRLTLNLTKFTRRGPGQKSKLSSNSNNVEKEEKPVQSVYVERQQSARTQSVQSQKHIQQTQQRAEESPYQIQVQPSNRTNQREVQQETTFSNRRSMFSDDFDSIISDGATPAAKQSSYQQNQQYQYRKPQPQHHYRVQQQPKPQQTSNNRTQQRQISNQRQTTYLQSNNSKTITRTQEKSAGKVDGSRRVSGYGPSSNQLNRVQNLATNAARQLQQKFDQNRQQNDQLIVRISNQKSQLLQTNTELTEAQFRMRNELQLLKIKNNQLLKDLEYARSLNEEQQGSRASSNQGVVIQLRETQSQLERTKDELWAKVDQNNKLLMAVKQLERRCHEYQDQAGVHQGNKLNFQRQLERDSKFNEARLQQLKNSYQFKLKQMQIHYKNSQEDPQTKQKLRDKERQITMLKEELSIRDEKVSELTNGHATAQRENLQYQLQSARKENNSLLEELNFTQGKIQELTNELHRGIKQNQIEIKRKECIINDLKDQIQRLQQSKKREGLDKKAYNEMYQNSSSAEQSLAFMELQQTQTQATNVLRDQIAQKTKQLYTAEAEIQQLRHKIRQLEQESNFSSRATNSNINNLKQYKQQAEITMRSQVQSLKRQMATLETRLQMKEREVRDRNRFIQQSLARGVSRHEEAAELILKLEKVLTG